ncbi:MULTISPECIES: cation:proton antiporter [Sphingobacterium]|jgi:CPA2 family monovalent cation:H+ antiporter-2|uniref:Cation:proton antiporter n=1 Tax=Sphingobacterium kitahiroshimense TaxID=470446 RepID=A0ABV0BTW5_9SPHI|nr:MULTISPECIES: cation:proton antiporter [Sphingobacterium]KKX51275.1 potassium transporter [Sphingobacterium sp. IITKGP-BTPF85]MCS3553132.1 CPA2 family monovalent cation:H+ antiporter-2 [Sphingobacterium sp. JUb21]MCW2262563.1 CPA2 family monovalent cation:H+ antiporter-2 [Sphingobacterium kitahiroshimense]NJI74544.1 cation:proton antiporter [Sphingobacterium sp. B16(2022)]TCR09658.1 potassium/proton antiporter membrane subunit (CPA2 family) [Sphingobacterium sp. JUb20]
MPSHTLILEIGIAVGLVAFVGLIANKLKFSVIPFFILIGMVLGQHAPQIGHIDLTFTESKPFIDFMGRLGVLFLLFYLGLEFSVGRLIKSGKSIVTGGTVYVLLNFVSGLLIGWMMDLPFKEMMVLCGIMTSSSTAIVAKVLTDLKRTANPETEVIMGMIMFDDLFIAMHISFLSGLILTGSSSFWTVAGTSLLALGFILTFLILGRKLVPAIDKLLQVKSSELFVLVIFALLFITAGFSETIHVAEAIGALMAGLVLADSQYIKKIEAMVLPYKDFFGAMFFFSFGLSIDILSLGGAVLWASIAALVTILGNLASGYFAARFSGMKNKTAFDIGFTLSARGEFSIIMANIGKAGGLLPVIQSFVVVYVLILSIVSPLLTKESRNLWTKLFGKDEIKPKTVKRLSDLESGQTL